MLQKRLATTVAVDVSYLERIGENLEIGDTVSFSFYDGTQESFVLSGFTDTGSTSDVYPVYFSEQYAATGSQLKDTLFVAAAQIHEAKSMTPDEFLDTIHAIGADCGIDRPSIGENSAFVQSLTFNPKNMLIAVCIGLVVLFAGVVVIYSIFYISIINRIQYFGQLRTIGTTGKQIKRIVKREGTLLFCVGAPLGLAIGSIFAWMLNSQGWSWINFAIWGSLILLLEYVAILYSISKPAKIASKVSPIEAYKTKGILQNSELLLSTDWDSKEAEITQLAGMIAVWNIIITLLAGGFLGVMLIRSLNSIGMNYLNWIYPIWFALLYAVVVIVMPAIITKVSIYLLQKRSIVERLREIE